MHPFGRYATIAVTLLFAASASAQDQLIDCLFDNKLLKPSKRDRSAEPEAWEWYESEDFRRRTFVFNTQTQKLVDGPGHQDVWREPQITMTTQHLEIAWRFWAAPLPREAKIELRVNRFTGDALESYSMLEGPNQGPRLVYWGRKGKCRIEARRF